MQEKDALIERGGVNRNYGLDVFKILCMFFVIAFHFSDHGSVQINCSQELTINWIILAVSRIFGALCNCGFMLISGYFLYQSKFKVKNIFRLWLEVWFYSVICGIASIVIGTESVKISSIVKMIFPFTFNQYWYFSTYIVIYLFFPFFNKLIDNLTRKQHQAFIFIGLFITSFLSTFTLSSWMVGSNSITIFIILYFVGAYLNRYDIKVKKNVTILLAALAIITEIISCFVMRIIYIFTGKDCFSYFIWGTEKFLPVFTSIVLFLLFKEIQVKGKGIILFLSSSVFGVYLFHIGSLNVFLFQKLFDDSLTYYTNLLWIQLLGAMISIFVVGILFDKIRIFLFEKPMLKRLNKYIDKINKKIQSYY